MHIRRASHIITQIYDAAMRPVGLKIGNGFQEDAVYAAIHKVIASLSNLL